MPAQFAQQSLGVQHAHYIILVVTVDRDAGELAVQHLVDDAVRLVGQDPPQILGRQPRAVVRPPLVKLDEAEIRGIAQAMKDAGLTREGAFSQAA